MLKTHLGARAGATAWRAAFLACALVQTLAVAAAAPAAPCAAPAGSVPASAPAAADGGGALLRLRLQLPPVLAGEFEQTRTLQGFRNPLVSHGEFLVARGRGVWWHTRQPFESTLVVTKTTLYTRAPDGTSTNVMDAQTEPGLRQVNEIVFSLLSGDIDALSDRFDVCARSAGATGWSATLVPRDPSVAKFVARVLLAGDRYVQSVRLEEARGDSTQIRFSHQVPGTALSPTDAARFQ